MDIEVGLFAALIVRCELSPVSSCAVSDADQVDGALVLALAVGSQVFQDDVFVDEL